MVLESTATRTFPLVRKECESVTAMREGVAVTLIFISVFVASPTFYFTEAVRFSASSFASRIGRQA